MLKYRFPERPLWGWLGTASVIPTYAGMTWLAPPWNAIAGWLYGACFILAFQGFFYLQRWVDWSDEGEDAEKPFTSILAEVSKPPKTDRGE
ncbi:MAG: hypothetical protein H0W86_04760 [Armatimonadetes bacterium]|nr:hypothetical protein [Armatimonadota bacterium]